MRKAFALTVMALLLATGTAMAESIDGRLGITGKGGAVVPLKDDFIGSTTDSKTALAAGGGLIFGFRNNLAAEIDVTHALSIDARASDGSKVETTLTDVSLGLQYRFAFGDRIVPYLGAGADFLTGTLRDVNGKDYELEWTEGGHVNAGFDYFIREGIALNAEVRGVLAARGDIKNTNTEYDPKIFIATLGLRLVLPKAANW